MRYLNDRLIRLAKFLIWANAILLVLDYFALTAYRAMHGGEPWKDFLIMSLCVFDIMAASVIIRGYSLLGIAIMGITSVIMFVISFFAGSDPFGWFDFFFYTILYGWDFAALLYLELSRKILA